MCLTTFLGKASLGVNKEMNMTYGYQMTPAVFEKDEQIAKLTKQRDALLRALLPFTQANVTIRGEIIGIMREDINRAQITIASVRADQ